MHAFTPLAAKIPAEKKNVDNFFYTFKQTLKLSLLSGLNPA